MADIVGFIADRIGRSQGREIGSELVPEDEDKPAPDILRVPQAPQTSS